MKTMLIVDDEQEMARSLGRIIERKGVKVLIALSGEEALRLYKENKPYCVFLDLHLSEMNGTEVLLKLKEIDSKVKAYFITGDQGFIDKQSPQSLGVLGYLLKPIDVEEVLKIIDEL